MIIILRDDGPGRNNSERHKIEYIWMGKEIKEEIEKLIFILYLRKLFRKNINWIPLYSRQ
jgi:hypothetical protein